MNLQDEIHLFFTTSRQSEGKTGDEGPTNREVELITKSREVNMADLQLQEIRQLFLKKSREFDVRWRKIEAGQLEVKQNLVKFNNFIREKEGKMESGEERTLQERTMQEQSDNTLAATSRLAANFSKAKTLLRVAVEKKTVYSEFLESVVRRAEGEYSDVMGLMVRCQGLLISRNNLKGRLQSLTEQIEREERELEKFKERKMEQTLDYNVRLSDQQQLYSVLAAKTLERTTVLRNTEERNTEKKLLISNIKLAILNMFSYTLTRAVSWSTDSEEEKNKRRSVGVWSQLGTILAHIEDLEVVRDRVSVSDNTTGYNVPLATEINNCV